MTLELGLNTGIIVSLAILVIKYVLDYQKQKDTVHSLDKNLVENKKECEEKIMSMEKSLQTEINHNHALFEIHRKDNEKEHTSIIDSNNKILSLLTDMNVKITQLFERMPKRDTD